MTHTRIARRTLIALLMATLMNTAAFAAKNVTPSDVMPSNVVLGSGWQLQDAAKVPQAGEVVSTAAFNTAEWYTATVPGTVLTTLVNNGVYPEPLYGENNRPEKISEALLHTSYWYRTSVTIPAAYTGRRIWLNFDGINYSSTIFVNGKQVGTTRGAFIRGKFDITSNVLAGKVATIAVLVVPQPNPGTSHEHILRTGMGLNGGESAIDGPTFLCTMGWDWIPAIRDRDTGIWQKVFLSSTGPLVMQDPLVTTDLPLPKTDSADVAVQVTVMNVTGKHASGVVEGTIDNIQFRHSVTIAAYGTQVVKFDLHNTPALHMKNPKLWWPNGYGPQNLYTLHLKLVGDSWQSDQQDVSFGVRKITYSVPDSENLTISVNGVRIFIRGGDWGLDEAMKRVSRDRLDAEIHMHQMANINMIRNWVGQSTSEDFYELCDKYGILLWDEFFQPNPSDGPNPTDIPTYVANVRDKVLHFRNHPSIAVWCARNEGYPPKELDDIFRKMMAELDLTRLYQPSSTDGHGVRSNGPYRWRTPREFYIVKDDYFKTETGSVSIPTIESIHGMMPQKDWETITDDWAEHDLARGASGGDLYPGIVASRYGKVSNLADFVQKAQLMNYEAYRSMYEGRNAQLFHPTTGILTWMSNPAQPSFVWQLYHYDLEPNASLFAVMHAGELVHIQLNEATGEVQVVNNLPNNVRGANAKIAIYNLNGTKIFSQSAAVEATADTATSLGLLIPDATSMTAAGPVILVRLELQDAQGKTLSSNTYWRSTTENSDDLTAMAAMPKVTLQATAVQTDADGQRKLMVTLTNPTPHIAVMTHLQLHRRQSGERVLPVFYSDNYITLLPNETRTISIDAALSDFHGEDTQLLLDGWNVTIVPGTSDSVEFAPNTDAQPEHWPVTGLPFQTVNLR